VSDVPENHPRYASLRIRDAIVAGVHAGITSEHGLIAHGRGEAFDYLLGEASHPFAGVATEAAAAVLLSARRPVVSVNGNAAALVGAEMVELAGRLSAPLEVNIFHASEARERAIRDHMRRCGASSVLMPTREAELSFIDSNRRFVHPDGIYRADAVFVPLEDGDRCQALRKMGKAVVTVDLNPLSRTARTASVTIVDNVVRALPALIAALERGRGEPRERLAARAAGYDNQATLDAAERRMRGGGR
jgi:4-phosphopantoate--beta-alanine ligase